MQTKIKLLFITAFYSLVVKAQYPCNNGISTNPLNPINNQLMSKMNTFFNWQDSLWAMQPSAFCFRTDFNESPFYKIDNLEELREAKDMKWDDGWELIRRFVGLTETNSYTATNPEHLYVVLYNKYTGILRVLLLACRGADYNAASIILQFDGTSQMKTDLLEFSREQVSALNKNFTPIIFTAASKYVNENNKWFYADFPVMYDPCTCIYESKLNIISRLVTTSSINIEGGVTGDILTQNVSGKGQVEKPGTYSWRDFSNTVNGKVTAVHGSIDKFKNETQKLAENFSRTDTAGKKNAVGDFADFLKNNTFLKAGLNSVPYLKSALSLIDVFSGGGKTTTGPLEVKLLPLSVNLTAKLSGTISTDNQYHNIIFSNPGSKDAHLDPDAYPYHNEVLGLFNLLNAPVIYYQSTIDDITEHGGSVFGHRVKVNNYKFNLDSLKYVLNPAADVTIQNMKVAMLVEASPSLSGVCIDAQENRDLLPDFVFEGVDANTGSYKFRTDYLDVLCFNERIFTTKSYFGRPFPDDPVSGISCWTPTNKVYLKFMLNLKRNNTTPSTQNILYVITFPMNQFAFDIASNFTDNKNCNDSTVIPSATNLEVNALCNSSVYYSVERQNSVYIDSLLLVAKHGKEDILIYPNPTKGTFNYKINPHKALLKQLVINDIQGRIVYNEHHNNINLNSGFTKTVFLNQPSGTYLVRAVTDMGILTTKLVISK
jgi:hypothetical protein